MRQQDQTTSCQVLMPFYLMAYHQNPQQLPFGLARYSILMRQNLLRDNVLFKVVSLSASAAHRAVPSQTFIHRHIDAIQASSQSQFFQRFWQAFCEPQVLLSRVNIGNRDSFLGIVESDAASSYNRVRRCIKTTQLSKLN